MILLLLDVDGDRGFRSRVRFRSFALILDVNRSQRLNER